MEGSKAQQGLTFQPCGTEAAYSRHRRAGEAPDEACLEAKRLAVARRREDPEIRERNRQAVAVRTRALILLGQSREVELDWFQLKYVRSGLDNLRALRKARLHLSKKYPVEFRDLLKEEKRKAWLRQR